MWAQENKALVRRFLEAQATSDLETLDELLAPDFVNHTLLPGQDPSREGYLRAIAEDHAALSDISTTIEYQATDGDDIVITRHTAHSIHDRGTPTKTTTPRHSSHTNFLEPPLCELPRIPKRRSSQNSQKAKFVEFNFHEVRESGKRKGRGDAMDASRYPKV